eukprot:COSAG01_NODE_5896_length_3965_cov_2.419296_4_plen_56_part_00
MGFAGLQEYVDNPQEKPLVDGGYYTETPELLPLIGPVAGEGADGAFLCGATRRPA